MAEPLPTPEAPAVAQCTPCAACAACLRQPNAQVQAAKQNHDPADVLELLRHFMKQHKSLEEDPFYAVAYKATSKVVADAAEAVARAKAAEGANISIATDCPTAAAGTLAAVGATPGRGVDESQSPKVLNSMQPPTPSAKSPPVLAGAVASTPEAPPGPA